jgi:hypothetical protein
LTATSVRIILGKGTTADRNREGESDMKTRAKNLNPYAILALLALSMFGQRLFASDCTSSTSNRSNCHLGNGSTNPAIEVNLGPIPIDKYDGVATNSSGTLNNGVILANCSGTPTPTIQYCYQQYMYNYNHNQSITGVRFQFGLAGGANSTPFDTSGNVSSTWVANLGMFFSDLYNHNITTITIQPNLGLWSDDSNSYYTTGTSNCDGSSLNFPYFLPFGVRADNGYPDCQGNNNAYTMTSTSTGTGNASFNCLTCWGWTPFYNLMDSVLYQASYAGLTVEELDLNNEMDIVDFPVSARLMYDNTSPNCPGMSYCPNILEDMQDKMDFYFGSTSRSLVTYSTLNMNPSTQTGGSPWNDGSTCNSVYSESALIIKQSSLYHALNGGYFGLPHGVQNDESHYWLYCNGTTSYMTQLPTSFATLVMPSVTDIHVWICNGQISSGSISCQDPTSAGTLGAPTARVTYNGIYSFLTTNSITANKVMLGEVNHNVTANACDTYYGDAAYSNVDGFNGYNDGLNTSSSLFQNLLSSTVFRMWSNPLGKLPVSQCYSVPYTLGPPYEP